MQPPVLEPIDLKKTIQHKEIIKGVNLTLGPGEILGFLGPNGAGKTTTIRMIVGLIKPTTGRVNICGYSGRKIAQPLPQHSVKLRWKLLIKPL